MTVIVRPEAETDIADGYEWYEAQRAGLGGLFMDEIAHCLFQIEREPFRYPVVQNEVRRAIVRRFPYAIYFVRGETHVSVLAAMHMVRHPRRWQRRTQHPSKQ